MKSEREPSAGIMEPPPGFVERAVAVGLAEVSLLEAIQAIDARTRRLRDSGVVAPWSDDAPTLPWTKVIPG